MKDRPMINLLAKLIKTISPVTVADEPAIDNDCSGCDDRTAEIMTGDTVMFWDDQSSSMQIGEFSHLYEWEEPMFESPYENECSVNGYDPVWRAIIRRWDGVLVAAIADSVELF
jgi:hypothetical protein